MGTGEVVATEAVPCPCGKGSITVKVTAATRGILKYRVEEKIACPACGFEDVQAARAALPVEPPKK